MPVCCAPMSYSWLVPGGISSQCRWGSFWKAELSCSCIFIRPAWYLTSIWDLPKCVCSTKYGKLSSTESWSNIWSDTKSFWLFYWGKFPVWLLVFNINNNIYRLRTLAPLVTRKKGSVEKQGITKKYCCGTGTETHTWGHDDCKNKVCYQRDISFQSDYSGLEYLHEYVSMSLHSSHSPCSL